MVSFCRQMTVQGTVLAAIPLLLLCGAAPMAVVYGEVLWVPHHMIAGQTYHGIVILPEASPGGSLVLLSSSGDLGMPQSLYIPSLHNHGIFEMTPAGDGGGPVEVFATVHGALHSADSTVYPETASPARLQLVLPANATRADSMIGYIAVVDEHGLPAILDEAIWVTLAASGSVQVPSGVHIANGTFYDSFYMDTEGSGKIVASAAGLQPDHAEMQRIREGVTVRVGIAPDIAMPDSFAYYYVWLEKDGAPLKPPGTARAFLHSDNHGVARTHAGPAFDSDGLAVTLVDGVARGMIYTGSAGHAVISATIPELGMGQDMMFVGAARLDGMHDDIDGRHAYMISEGQEKEEEGDPEANLIRSWIYPEVTDGAAWGVAATYSVDRDRYLDARLDESGGLETVISEDMILAPVETDGRTVYVSSPYGLEHADALVMAHGIMPTNAAEFEITGTGTGSYEMSLSGQGLESASSQVNVTEPHGSRFQLGISALPVLGDTWQDLAMISVVDGDGALIDAAEILGRDAEIYVVAPGSISSGPIPPVHSGSAILDGMLDGPAQITAILDGVGSASSEIIPAGVATSLELLLPESVHIGEEFPFVVHETDKAGIPIRKADSVRISTPLELSAGAHMVLRESGAGNVSAISGAGADASRISGFANIMRAELDVDRDRLRVGETARIEVLNDIDAQYSIDTRQPFERVSDSVFVITADSEGESTVSILATRPGYEPVMLSAELQILHIYLMDVDVTDSGGMRIHPMFTVTAGPDSAVVGPPYHTEFRPGTVKVKFPEHHSSDTGGYSFDHAVVNGETTYRNNVLSLEPDGDIAITAVYRQEVLITVFDGEGSGVYGVGQAVTVSAPERHVASFLVREVFERWDGLEHGSATATFAAEENMEITAIYRTDYTYLMVMVAAPLLAGSAIVLYRMSGPGWAMKNVIDRVACLIPGISAKRDGGRSPDPQKKD